jgi:hypothetical protein
MVDIIVQPTNIEDNHVVKQEITQTWKSCCFTINPNAVKYFTQVIILSSLIIFSAVMLVVDERCESQRNYGSLLMICLGVFLPQPKIT